MFIRFIKPDTVNDNKKCSLYAQSIKRAAPAIQRREQPQSFMLPHFTPLCSLDNASASIPIVVLRIEHFPRYIT